MQALWSRAGQARHCGCKVCFDATAGMMRHSATRATRRKPTFSEMFTACYTSIMGTAAVLDAKRKDERRKDLDRQLDEAKAEFAKLMENAPADIPETAPAGHITNRYKGALAEHKKQKSEVSDFFSSLGHTHTWSRVSPRSTEVEMVWAQYGLEPSRNSMNSLLETDYLSLDRLLVEEEALANLQHRSPRTIVQLRAAETSVKQLVSSLLSEKSVIESGATKTKKSKLDKAKHDACDMQELQQELAELKRSNYPRYDREVDSGALRECSANLNKSLREIFEAAQPSNPRPTILKVCHNLLISPQPPTIHTYNTLIKGFDAAGFHRKASAMVKALYHSKVEPTQGTLVCLLNHFKETQGRGDFNNVIERMIGKDCRGIHIRRKPIGELFSNPRLRGWAQMKDIAITRDYVIERAWFDVRVFSAIVEGMLSFRYLRNAVATVAFGLSLGLRFSVRTISQLLEYCVRSLDPKAAIGILGAFATTPKLVETVFWRECDQIYLAQRTQNLLDIGGIKGLSPASVMPFLGDLPASSLPCERQRRGMDVVRLVRLIEQSEVKLEYFKRTLNSMRVCLVDPELKIEGPGASLKRTKTRKDPSRIKKAMTDNDTSNGAEEMEAGEEQHNINLMAVDSDKTSSLHSDGRADAWARLEAARRIPTYRTAGVAASAIF